MAAVMMTVKAWWARLRKPYVDARLERTWRAYDSHMARRGCRRYVPEDDDPDDGHDQDGRGWDGEAHGGRSGDR